MLIRCACLSVGCIHRVVDAEETAVNADGIIGCAATDEQALSLGETKSTSGNAKFDQALIAELKSVDKTFIINPGYRYLIDGNKPNAYATAKRLVANTKGTILIGLGLVGDEIAVDDGGAAVAGIVGHEAAHIYQFDNQLLGKLKAATAVFKELHADFLAGWYFYSTGRQKRSIEAFRKSLFAKGDFQFNDPNHHGTPDQRVDAMLAGYKATGKVKDVATEGIRYVKSL